MGEDEASLLWSHDVAVFEHGGGDGPMPRDEWRQDEENVLWVETEDGSASSSRRPDGRLRVSFVYADTPTYIVYERDDDATEHDVELRIDSAIAADADGSESGSESGSRVARRCPMTRRFLWRRWNSLLTRWRNLPTRKSGWLMRRRDARTGTLASSRSATSLR